MQTKKPHHSLSYDAAFFNLNYLLIVSWVLFQVGIKR